MDNLGAIFDIMNVFFGVFRGPLLGCTACTISSRHVRGPALMTGMGLGCVAGFLVECSSLANLWVTLATSLVTFAAAWLGSHLARGLAKPA